MAVSHGTNANLVTDRILKMNVIFNDRLGIVRNYLRKFHPDNIGDDRE